MNETIHFSETLIHPICQTEVMTSESARTQIDGSDESKPDSLGSTINLNRKCEVKSVNAFVLDARSVPREKETEEIDSFAKLRDDSTEMRCFGGGSTEFTDGKHHLQEQEQRKEEDEEEEEEEEEERWRSDYGRRKFVEDGLVCRNLEGGIVGVRDVREWVVSSIKTVSGRISPKELDFGSEEICDLLGLTAVTFESGSRLERIEKSAFLRSGLQSIVIPSSVIVFSESSFSWCKSLESGIFETGSRLERIENSAFEFSGLKSIVIPSSVIVLSERSFGSCESLESVIFETGSRLERIENSAFLRSGLKSIVIPSSVIVLSERSFGSCESLESVIFESGSRMERID
jgi:hypothetical protein